MHAPLYEGIFAHECNTYEGIIPYIVITGGFKYEGNIPCNTYEGNIPFRIGEGNSPLIHKKVIYLVTHMNLTNLIMI